MVKSTYFWTEEEIGALKKSYVEGSGLPDAVEAIPGKSMGTIATKACRLRITAAKPRRNSVLNNSSILGQPPRELPSNGGMGT